MEIPDCYDPVYQAERLEAAADRRSAWYPRCGCCGEAVPPGRSYFELNVLGKELKVCGVCRGLMDLNEVLVEM